jgi:hypothetical protein
MAISHGSVMHGSGACWQRPQGVASDDADIVRALPAPTSGSGHEPPPRPQSLDGHLYANPDCRRSLDSIGQLPPPCGAMALTAFRVTFGHHGINAILIVGSVSGSEDGGPLAGRATDRPWARGPYLALLRDTRPPMAGLRFTFSVRWRNSSITWSASARARAW